MSNDARLDVIWPETIFTMDMVGFRKFMVVWYSQLVKVLMIIGIIIAGRLP